MRAAATVIFAAAVLTALPIAHAQDQTDAARAETEFKLGVVALEKGDLKVYINSSAVTGTVVTSN